MTNNVERPSARRLLYDLVIVDRIERNVSRKIDVDFSKLKRSSNINQVNRLTVFMERMQLQSKDWFLDAEIMIKAKRLGLEVLEFNVLAQMREGGTSNVRLDTCWEFVLNLLRFRFSRGERIAVQPSVPEDTQSG